MKRIALLLIVICSVAMNAQITVRGVVADAFNESPVAGATVCILGTKPLVYTLSNENGEFTLKVPQPGRYSLSAAIVGYTPQTFSNLMVSAGKEAIVTFRLVEKVTNLKEVEVRPTVSKERPLNDMAMISARSFTVEETERFAGSLGDPARMVANYAGVMAGNDSRNDIIIRGNSPLGLLWRIEGVEISNPNHFGAQGTTGGPVSMLNSNLLANSDFLTGAFPAEYGNALSGVFDINLRSGNKEKFEFTGQVGFNGFEGAVEGPISLGKTNPKGSFLVDYRYSTLQLVSKMGMDMGTGTAIPNYQDLTVMADLPFRKLGRFRFVGILGNSSISFGRTFNQEAVSSNQVGYATDFDAGLNIALLTHTLQLNDKLRLKSAVSFQNTYSHTLNDSIDYDNQKFATNYAGRLSENKWLASTELKYKISTMDNLTAGVQLNRYLTSFKDSIHSNEYHRMLIISDVSGRGSSLFESFINWQHRFAESLSFTTGLHYQYYDLSSESALEPRLGVQWKLSPLQTFSFGYGNHSQIQTRNVYFNQTYNPSTSTYDENNLNLKFTRSNHFVAGYDRKLDADFRIKTEAYYQQIYNVPVSKANQQFSMLNSGSGYYIERVDSLQNTGRGYNYGLELTLEKFMNKGWYGLLTVSLYDSKYKAYDQVWRNTAFNTNYVVNFLCGYEWKVGKKNFLTLDLRTVYSGGMRYIPIDVAESKAKSEIVYDWSQAYDHRQKDYFRTDFRIGFRQNFKHISQEWGLDLQNVSNHKNIFADQYNAATQEVVTVYQQGFLPMMLYRINF
ncbi:MAG: hypothetical protein RIS29_2522 [Bacteroidota bacterium]|jgi:hypothetical protein